MSFRVSLRGLVVATIVAAGCGGSGSSSSLEADGGAGSGNGLGDAASGGDDASPSGSGMNDASAPSSGDGGNATPTDGGATHGPGGALPSPTGTCPDFQNGTVTFSPAGIPARTATVWMTDAAKTKHGPLLVYWHGTGSAPAEAAYALGSVMSAIEAAGGIVVAPAHDSNAGQFPWYLVSSTKDDDLRVADEVVACAMQKVGIDTSHVHTLGMSAGGLQTTQMSFLRSAYLASVVVYSGGLGGTTAPAYEDPSNKFPAMIFFGGASDNVYNFDFQAASQRYKAKLTGDGHFAFLCDHNRGHMIPTDAAQSVWDFFLAHPFGTNPSPYAGGLPAGFPTYCSLN